jgi:hypothetical protein
MSPSGIETTTFRVEAQCLIKLHQACDLALQVVNNNNKKKAKVLVRTDYPHRASRASRIDRHVELKELATSSRYVSRGR